MRLFIAINFSPDTRSQLLAVRDELRSYSKSGNYTVPENIHLTLAFIGECTVKQAAAVKATMDATRFEPLPISIDCVGRFKRNDGDLWWMGLAESKPLLKLQRELTDKLGESGFNLEKRKYSPHITLGRKIVTDVAPWTVEPFGEIVNTIELMQSERLGSKLVYTSVYESGGHG